MTAVTSKFSREVLSERIKNYILNLILEAKVRPGQRIVESALARELGVSQAPVREAIRDLVLIGILRNKSYHGTFVCDFTVDEIVQAYQVRAAMESTGVKLAIERMTDEEVGHLETLCDKMLQLNSRGKSAELMEMDNLFHSEIMRLSGNKVLYQLWKTLKYDIWTKISYSKIPDKEFLAARHKEVMRAIARRNPSAAGEAMKHHFLDLQSSF